MMVKSYTSHRHWVPMSRIFMPKSLFTSRNQVKMLAAITGSRPMRPCVFTHSESPACAAMKSSFSGTVMPIL